MSGQQAPRSAYVVLEEVEAIRRRMLNVVGHELRTPVTTIHGLAQQVMAASDLTTIHTKLGPALLRNARRVEELLDDLLVAAGVRTALPVGAPADLVVAELAREVWAGLADPRPLETAGNTQVRVHAARDTMRRVLHHVLENASRYGTRGPTLVLGVRDGVADISVRSPGAALHPEEIRLALEPFYRGELAVTRAPGLGIGLAVADHLARSAGGSLTFEALLEGGTVTTIHLPASEQEAQP